MYGPTETTVWSLCSHVNPYFDRAETIPSIPIGRPIGNTTVYVVDAVPREDAAVVWGKERLRIREDLVLLELTYFDQDMQPVRQMVASTHGQL